MLEIKIKRLCLENFKCHKSLHLDFDGANVSIYGDNASGKTSIYDALTWLLFGKDSRGNGEKNIEVKPLNVMGEVEDHLALTAVEAVLLINGEELTLRRTYKEIWTTKRGSSEATYDGNASEYYVDGVPCKKNAFQDRVNELIGEDIFRLLTSVTYFANDINWQERRAVLFNVAGVMDDAQILATNEAFFPLVESMGKLSLEDYKKKLIAEKKKFAGAKTEIPARISECQKTISDIESLDFAGAKAAVETINAKKEAASAQILSLDHNSAAEQKSIGIREAQLELSQLESENKAYRDSQSAGSTNVHSLNIRLMALQTQLLNVQKVVSNEVDYIGGVDSKIAECRQKWKQINNEVFTGGACVTCGQVLPADKLQAAKDMFESRKRKRLGETEQAADTYKATKAQAQQRLESVKQQVQDIESEISDLQAQIQAAESAKVDPQDMVDYAQRKKVIQEHIDKLNADLLEIHEDTASVRMKLQQEVSELSNQISQYNSVISKESLLDYSRQRVEQLRQDAQNAAQRLESIEKMLYLMDEYSRYKTRFVEDSINGLFRIARFRLFREQANGGIEDRCDVVYDGVPYISVNNGMKINLGIDIINTLSVAYGVHVPLFVDNAESVTRLEQCESQIIRLVVSENDKELRCSYEN